MLFSPEAIITFFLFLETTGLADKNLQGVTEIPRKSLAVQLPHLGYGELQLQ